MPEISLCRTVSTTQLALRLRTCGHRRTEGGPTDRPDLFRIFLSFSLRLCQPDLSFAGFSKFTVIHKVIFRLSNYQSDTLLPSSKVNDISRSNVFLLLLARINVSRVLHRNHAKQRSGLKLRKPRVSRMKCYGSIGRLNKAISCSMVSITLFKTIQKLVGTVFVS